MAHRVCKVLLAPLGQLDPLVRLAVPAALDLLVLRELIQPLLVPPGLPAQRALQVPLAPRELKEIPDRLVLKAFRAFKAYKVTLVLLVLRGLPAQQVVLARLVLREPLALKVQPVRQDPLVLRGRLEQQDLPERKGILDQLGRRVSRVFKAFRAI